MGQYDTSEEITMVEKEISLGLSEEEYGILDSLCGEHGISVERLFRRFSKDLTGLEYPSSLASVIGQRRQAAPRSGSCTAVSGAFQRNPC